ncbi:hypothetical protein KTC96_07750 [Clostridium estertheticum]|uniref:hypothetical protein n=1 Tax=Clostridium estertheticum TaxID=238834 RepID=UPI001C7CAFB4|nr:hypothetical protein [Clostridium estertheticum]MBX4261189.1 hypothetical protein [Clostridium estertheticum]WLC71880.1 hypothetical protein KTC96_07750 [Clostridium estertheticum]
MPDMWMCVGNIRRATEGKLFLSYGEVFTVINKIRLTSIDKDIKLFVSNDEINIFFKHIETSYPVYGVWITKGYNNCLRKLFNLKPKKKLTYSRVDLDIFDKVTLHRIYIELLLYLYKVKSDKLLIQFSTIIKYQLESLKMIYKNKDLVNFDEEFEQTKVQFRKIYEFCNSIELKTKQIELEYRRKVIKEQLEKRKEINKLNILMLDEINRMKD